MYLKYFWILKIINSNTEIIKKKNFRFATKIYMYFYLSNLEITHDFVRILRDIYSV
jgi:hypothetical protein